MKIALVCCLLGLAGCASLFGKPEESAGKPAEDPGIVVKVLADRADPFYKCGETAIFTIKVTENDKPVTEGEVTVVLSLDGGRKIAEKTITLGPEPATISGTLNEPGFLLCTATLEVGEEDYSGCIASPFEPERIKPAAILPDDFDEFWAKGRARVDAIPMDLQLTLMPKFSNDKQETFKLSMTNIDNTRIYGWLSIPKDKKPPYPAFVSVPGSGVGAPYEPIISESEAGALSLVMGVHTHDLGLPDEEYGKLARGPLRHYHSIGAPDLEKYFHRRSILGIDRAIRYLTSRPDWDGEHLVYMGSSQGGGMGLVLAGLNPEFTAIAVNVPGFCDRNAWRAERGRRTAPPGDTEKERKQYEKMNDYFDAVNFARKIHCPVIMSVGYMDRTCIPSCIYAAFNVIDAPKKMLPGPRSGHCYIPAFTKHFDPWLEGQMGRAETIPPTAEQRTE